MDVTHFITSLALGGGEKNLLRLIRNTDDIDHTVCFIGIDRTLEEEFTDAGATVIDLGYDGPTDFLSFLRGLYQYLSENNPEVLHLHLEHAIVFGRIIGTVAGIESIVGSHQNIAPSYPRFWRYMERVTRPLEDTSIAVSKAVLRSFVSDLEKDGWKVIYNGINVAEYNQTVSTADSFSDDGLMILNIARYHKQKNQTFLIDGLKELEQKTEDFSAYIVGWGKLEGQLRSKIRENDLDEKVELTGKVKNVKKYYNSADVFVLPSNHEGLPLTAIEAMSSGLPMVGTRVPGIKEVIDDGKTGYLVTNNDADELSDSLSQLQSGEKRAKMGKNAYEKAVSLFSVETMVEEHEELYNKLSSKE